MKFTIKKALKNIVTGTVAGGIHTARLGVKLINKEEKEGNGLFNDALNTFYLRLYAFRHMIEDHSDSERKENRCRHIGYSFRLTARVLLYAPSHIYDSHFSQCSMTGVTKAVVCAILSHYQNAP